MTFSSCTYLLACLFNTRDLNRKHCCPWPHQGLRYWCHAAALHSRSATVCISGKPAILCCMQGAGTADVRLQGPNWGTGANVDALAAWKAGEPIDERGLQQHTANLPPSGLAGRPIIGQSCTRLIHSPGMSSYEYHKLTLSFHPYQVLFFRAQMCVISMSKPYGHVLVVQIQSEHAAVVLRCSAVLTF